MAVYNDHFGERVRTLLSERKLGPNDVQRMSAGTISHQTVRNMMRGVVPYADYILEFVKALETDQEERKLLADELLRLGRKEFTYAHMSLTFAAR